MKGQVTAEYLLILMVSVALVGMSVGALSTLNDKATQSSQVTRFKNDADLIISTINEVCAMGDGSRMTITLSDTLSVREEGELLQVRSGNLTRESSRVCDIESFEGNGRIRIENNDRTIEIRGK